MLSRLARDTVIYGSSTLLVRGIQIVLIPVYTRLLGSNEYGIVEMVAVLGALVNLTVALEISQGVARHLADVTKGVERRSYASTAVLFSACAYAMFTLSAWVLAAPLAQLLFDSDQWASALRVAVTALAVNGVFVLLQDLLRWQLRPGSYAAASIAYAIASAGIGIYLVAVVGFGVAGVFWGQLAGAVVGALVAAPALGDLVGVTFDRGRLRRMLLYSAPLVLSSAAVFANLFIDRIAVKEFLGIGELGVYGVAARFASVVALLTVGIQAALTPLVFRNFRDPAIKTLLARAFRYYCAGMVPVIGFLSLFSGEILYIFTGPEFHAGRKVLPVLALAALFVNLYIFFPGLFLVKRTGLVAAINIAAAGLNLLLNLLFVPSVGTIAAALAAAISTATAFGSLAILGQRHYAVPFLPWKSGASLVVATGLAGIGVWWNSAPPSMELAHIAFKFLLLATGGGLAIVLGLCPEDRACVIVKVRSRWKRASLGGM